MRVRYGYPHIQVLPQWEGRKANRKQVYRLYRSEGLARGANVRDGTTRRAFDALFNRCRLRDLTLMDNFAHEALVIIMDSRIRGKHMVRAVERVTARRDALELIRVGNGPEFVSKVLDR